MNVCPHQASSSRKKQNDEEPREDHHRTTEATTSQALVTAAAIAVPVTTLDVELLRLAQRSTARRHARMAAKKATATAPPPKTLRRSLRLAKKV